MPESLPQGSPVVSSLAGFFGAQTDTSPTNRLDERAQQERSGERVIVYPFHAHVKGITETAASPLPLLYGARAVRVGGGREGGGCRLLRAAASEMGEEGVVLIECYGRLKCRVPGKLVLDG